MVQPLGRPFFRRIGLPFMPRQSGGYSSKVESESPANLLAYWQLNEGAGPTAADSSGNGRSGTEVGAPAWGQTGIGDGKTSVLFDGAKDAIDIYSASLQSAFDGGEGTMMLWAKVSGAGVWTDATLRWLFYLFVDGNNFIRIIKLTSEGDLQYAYRSGGTAQLSRTVATGSPTGWFHVAITWSRLVNEVRSYFNGSEAAAALTITADFAGSLSANNTVLGASNDTPSQEWDGGLDHAAVWDTPLTASQISNLARL